jgi:hypothetical protein
MLLQLARVTYDEAVHAGTTLEVLQLEQLKGWQIKAHQQTHGFQSDYWCSVEHLTLGPVAGRGSSVLGAGTSLDEALRDLARQLSGKEVTVYEGGHEHYHRLPELTHTLPVTL